MRITACNVVSPSYIEAISLRNSRMTQTLLITASKCPYLQCFGNIYVLREFRNLVIEMVLGTDMSSHFQQLKTMKSLLAHSDLSVDKPKAMSLILHCCDISHPSKQFDIHSKWTGLLMEEFFRQVIMLFYISLIFIEWFEVGIENDNRS